MNKIAKVAVSLLLLSTGVLVAYSQISSSGRQLTITQTANGTNNKPADCTAVTQTSANGLSAQLAHSGTASVGSMVCIYLVVTNTGNTVVPISNDQIRIQITDSNGRLVYTTGTAVGRPNATLLPGQVWDFTDYWDTSQAFNNGPIPAVGMYHISAQLTGYSKSAFALLLQSSDTIQLS